MSQKFYFFKSSHVNVPLQTANFGQFCLTRTMNNDRIQKSPANLNIASWGHDPWVMRKSEKKKCVSRQADLWGVEQD